MSQNVNRHNALKEFHKKILNKDGTTTMTLEVNAGTTLYNEAKKMTGSASAAAVKAVKTANPTVKNVVTKTTNVKVYNNTVFGTVTADELKKKSGYITSAKPPQINALHNSAIFGQVTSEELKKKSGYISASKPAHCYWDMFGNVHYSKGGS